jgi:hypothetical protein
MNDDELLRLLARFQAEGVQYLLVGGHAVRPNGASTRDKDCIDREALSRLARRLRDA